MAKIDDSVKKKVPELRFPGFTDDWEERKLGDLATSFEYGLNASAKSFDGTHKYIRITDIDDSSRKFNSQSLTSPDIDLSSADNYKLKNGDILFARTGASVGKSYIYADSDGLVYYAGFLIRARIKSGVDSNFVFQHTLTSSYENFIRVTSQRSGQPGVNAKEYSTFEISVPSYEEQRKIGSFFQQLDETIALHQRKLDLLKEQKKGYLQKMFPKNGAKVPELRFAGFADDWEERKFFESIASTIDFRGRTPKKLGMDWSDSGYLALSALNVKNGYIDPLADAHYGDEKLYRKWMSGRELKKGQVLFTTEAPMGNVAQVPDDNGYILSQRTVAFETKEDMMTNDFLAVLLKSPLVFNNLSALSSGGTAKGVSQKSLKGLSITVPLDIDEQQKIGSFFKQLDNSIALHQRKLDLLKEQKKGFLQKMFV